MKITTANGKLSVTLDRKEWESMGSAMGWLNKEAKEAFPGAAPQFGKKKKDGEGEEEEEKESCSPCESKKK